MLQAGDLIGTRLSGSDLDFVAKCFFRISIFVIFVIGRVCSSLQMRAKFYNGLINN